MAHSDNLHQHWPSLLSIQVVYLGSLPNNKRELCSRWIVGRWAALFKYLNSKWNKAVIWHTDENLMIPLESSFMFKLERLYYFISKLEMTLSLCDNEITHGARNTLFYLISLEFYIGLSSSLWLWETVKKHLVIQTELQRSLDLLFQNQKSNINPVFFLRDKKRPEIFETASLETSNPRVNFNASQTVQRTRQRIQPRRGDIKRERREKLISSPSCGCIPGRSDSMFMCCCRQQSSRWWTRV